MVDVVKSLPKCAILLAAYNGMDYLEAQISSIKAQKKVAFTVFISLDYSTDGSKEWLDKLVKEDPRFILLTYGMRFQNPARNFFRLIREVDCSEFDYIALSDQDDIWHEDKLIRACTLLKDPCIAAYSSNVTAFWSDGRQLLIHKSQAQQRYDYLFEAAGPGCTYVMKPALIKAIQEQLLEMPERLDLVSLHDWYIYAFARTRHFTWYIDSKPSMLYRQHGNNLVGASVGLKAKLQRLQKLKSGWWLAQSLLIAELTGVKNHPFVKAWSRPRRSALLYLAIHARHCRRKRGDQILFFFACLVLALTQRPLKQKDSL